MLKDVPLTLPLIINPSHCLYKRTQINTCRDKSDNLISSPNLLLISDISVVSNNPVADALSQLEIQAIQQGPSMIDFTAMAISQQSHQEFQAIQLSTSWSLKFTDIFIDGTDTTLVCDTSTGVL